MEKLTTKRHVALDGNYNTFANFSFFFSLFLLFFFYFNTLRLFRSGLHKHGSFSRRARNTQRDLTSASAAAIVFLSLSWTSDSCTMRFPCACLLNSRQSQLDTPRNGNLYKKITERRRVASVTVARCLRDDDVGKVSWVFLSFSSTLIIPFPRGADLRSFAATGKPISEELECLHTTKMKHHVAAGVLWVTWTMKKKKLIGFVSERRRKKAHWNFLA